MSDFWEKNKGSITSGLKTAGKYGYQGSKYVAKTGYQAGKKNFNSKKKNEQGQKEKGKEEEEDEELEAHAYNRSYGNQYRDAANFPTPPMRGGQGAPQPYQQPQFQQPYQQQYQQPQYPQQQYSQPQYQQPQYQQPQYQQPQYQQPQYQQPPYQQPPYQAPQYQPQYQQQYPQQPVPGQFPPQPAPQYQQPLAQPIAAQQPVNPAQPPQLASVTTQAQPVPPQREPQPPAVHGVALPGMIAPPAVLSPRPLQPSEVQTTDLSSVPSISSSGQSTQVSAPFQEPLAPAYSRARLSSPPIPAREPQPLPASASSTRDVSGSPIQGVTPFDYSDAQDRRELKRLPTSPIDVTALPPPPTHRDRGSTPDIAANKAVSAHATGQTDSTQASAHTSEPGPEPIVPAPLPSRGVPALNTEGRPTAVTEEYGEKLDVNEPGIPSLPPKSVPNSDTESRPTAVAEEHIEKVEVIKPGIAGKFDYDVKVGYAPPPKPHRNASASKPLARKATAPPSNGPSTNATAPPALPRRQTSSGTESNVSKDAPSLSFQPPPKPFRSSDSSQSSRQASHHSITTIAKPAVVDVSSFPPPPVQRGQSNSSILIRPESTDAGEDRKPTPRGRIPADVSHNGDVEASEPEHIRKKAPPPAVKPKPKTLSINHAKHNGSSEISEITNELATFKLKKTGSGFLKDSAKDSQTKRSPPPVVPRKKESLKSTPPVPIKSRSLRAAEARQEQDDDLNPFEHYLKSAVPTENDRLHR